MGEFQTIQCLYRSGEYSARAKTGHTNKPDNYGPTGRGEQGGNKYRCVGKNRKEGDFGTLGLFQRRKVIKINGA